MTIPRTSGPRQILSSAITSRTMLAPFPTALNIFIEWLEVARACNAVRQSEEKAS